jgi:hypothetical protein
MTDQPNIPQDDDYRQYASTQDEILQAVRDNSVRRGMFFLKNLSALDVDGIVRDIEQLGADYDMELWRERAEESSITTAALDILDTYDPPVPYPYYFCLPGDLVREPRLILYYRNVAMISNKVMNNIGMGTIQHEVGLPLSVEKAHAIAQHFNQINSALVMETGLYGQRRHLEMMYVNIGASLDGGWRNEVGRLAYVSVISPIVLYLHRLQKLKSIIFKLKGRIVLDEEDENDNGKLQEIEVHGRSEQEMTALLSNLEDQRIVYRQINLTNGNRILLNRQMYWYSHESQRRYRIGPDLITMTPNEAFPWAAELKGGADPAGSDEHWKTATQAFNRMIDAAEQTNRPVPRLSFMATILVDRVAQEAALWLKQGKLVSVYNLTKIANDPTMQQEFLNQMVMFFEMTAD